MTDPAGPQPPFPSWPDPASQPPAPSPWARPGAEDSSGTVPDTDAVPAAPPRATPEPPQAGPTPTPALPTYPVGPAGPPPYPVGPPGMYYPISGYYVPSFPMAYQYPRDPLVTSRLEGVGGWWRRVWAAFGRAWVPLLVIMLVTSAVPEFLFGLATNGLADRWILTDPAEPGSLYFDWSAGRELIAAWIGFLVISAFLDGLGWSAAIWAITRRAAGAPAPLGAAFGYGLRNCARVGGLLIVTQVIWIVGMAALVVPGVYLARDSSIVVLLLFMLLACYFPIATSLVAPFAVYERSGAIGGSFRTVHRNFGAVLGRYALMAGTLVGGSLVASCLISLVAGVGTIAANGQPATSSQSTVGGAVGDVVLALIGVALSAIIAGVSVVTYAEMRGRTAAITTQDLNTALDR